MQPVPKEPSQPQAATAQVVERLPRREQIVVESAIPVLDTAMFDHMQRIAKAMASTSLVPAHLNSVRKEGGQEVEISKEEAVANCFMVANQAVRWRMDPFAVAQHVFTTKGRLGYEGKLIAAIINSHPLLEKRLTYTYEGAGEARKVTVSARIKGDDQDRTISGTVKDWKTTHSGSPWSNANQHDQMLSYRGAREWARRWMPEAVLGVWGDDEIAQFDATDARIAAEGNGNPGAEPAARGAAGLKAALQANAASATDADIVQPGEPKPADSAGVQPAAAEAPKAPVLEKGEGGKFKGTLELHQKYLDKFKACNDLEMLGIFKDESRTQYEWTPTDAKTLDEAYAARVQELNN